MSFREKFFKIKEKVLDSLFPRDIKCIFCGDELTKESDNSTCAKCLKTLPFIKHKCGRCGGEVHFGNVCKNCKLNNHNFVQAKSVFNYDDDVTKVVHMLKYGGKLYLAEPMAKFMAQELATWDISPDMITAVPLHDNREKDRGYNQSRLLAENISKSVKIPYVEIADKIVDNPSQTQLGYEKRRENVKGVYKLKSNIRRKIKGKKILIIDDIFTTGATVDELSKVLLDGGASEIFVLTFAHGVADKKI